MRAIARFRTLFSGTLLLSDAGFAAAWFFCPREPSWLLWFLYPFLVFSGLCALTALTLILASIGAKIPKDLWNSFWFSYMSDVWGYQWKGDYYGQRKIDGCKTHWLTFAALGGWLINVGLAIFASVIVAFAAMGDALFRTPKEGLAGDIGMSGILAAIALLVVFGLSCGLFHGTKIGIAKVAAIYGITVGAGLLLDYLVIVPMHFISPMQYFAYCFYVLAGAGALVVVCKFILWPILKAFGRLLAAIGRGIASSRAVERFKDEACVIMREDEDEG